jgi:hypothetical protein
MSLDCPFLIAPSIFSDVYLHLVEIDYQQVYVLNVYWDQFFDRESGVYFYQYIVGPSCENKHTFDLDLTTNPNVSIKLKTFNIIVRENRRQTKQKQNTQQKKD